LNWIAGAESSFSTGFLHVGQAVRTGSENFCILSNVPQSGHRYSYRGKAFDLRNAPF
jgi:hypothetical protein